MPRSARTYPTIEEALATIRHSGFPSVIVEGHDDVIVYRRLEDELMDTGLTLLPVGGKDAVLQMHARRAECGAGARILFIVDSDMWVFAGLPSERVTRDFKATSGYSIENDMFEDGHLINLLPQRARKIFEEELQVILDWFALMVWRLQNGISAKLDVHPVALLDDLSYRSSLLSGLPDETYPTSLRRGLGETYGQRLRGKTLFALLVRHCPEQTHASLLSFGVSRRGKHFLALVNQASALFRLES